MSCSCRWYLLPLLTAGLAFLAGTAPAVAATPAGPLATPGQGISLLVEALPFLAPLGHWLGLEPPQRTALADENGGEPIDAAVRNEDRDPALLPPPEEAPGRDGGYGGWGDEASGPWPRS